MLEWQQRSATLHQHAWPQTWAGLSREPGAPWALPDPCMPSGEGLEWQQPLHGLGICSAESNAHAHHWPSQSSLGTSRSPLPCSCPWASNIGQQTPENPSETATTCLLNRRGIPNNGAEDIQGCWRVVSFKKGLKIRDVFGQWLMVPSAQLE